MATAWLAPLPPARLSNPEEEIVSPGRDMDFTLGMAVNQGVPDIIKHSATTMKILVNVWGGVKRLASSTAFPSFDTLMDPLTRHFAVILVVLNKQLGDRASSW
jgi:hypothetical protein